MNEIENLLNILRRKNLQMKENILIKIKSKNKEINDYNTFNSDLNNLLNIFLEDMETDYDLISEYNAEKETYEFNVKNIYFNNAYEVFLTITDKSNIYSNILRKSFDNEFAANKYFDDLRLLIEDNNVNDISIYIINKLK